MRTTIISKSKKSRLLKQKDLQKDGPLRYDNRFIGLVRKVRGAANADNDNIEVQKSRLLKPLSQRRDSPDTFTRSRSLTTKEPQYYGNL